jgi:hypothetical protein
MVAPRSALGWAIAQALGSAQGRVAKPTLALGSALWDKCPLESEPVPMRPAPSLRICFLSAFPCAPISASLAPMTVSLAPMIAGLAPVVGGLMPRETVLGRGGAVAPLTGGLPCRT